jgi:CHASE2 domain-containing sensor protein
MALIANNDNMKLPARFSFRSIDSWLETRSFQYIFWTLAVVAVALIVLLFMQTTIHRVELALMDLKMRLRTDSAPNALTTPSKDIIILGIDRNTDQYIRQHPESGLEITIPRAKLATVLNYLTDQGVRAIVLDLEFKDPRDGDKELAAAIRRNGHVYAADRIVYIMDSFENDVMHSCVKID